MKFNKFCYSFDIDYLCDKDEMTGDRRVFAESVACSFSACKTQLIIRCG